MLVRDLVEKFVEWYPDGLCIVFRSGSFHLVSEWDTAYAIPESAQLCMSEYVESCTFEPDGTLYVDVCGIDAAPLYTRDIDSIFGKEV